MNELKATYWGYLAVVMWGLLALFTVLSAPIPPFQLTALSFGIGGILGLIWVVATGEFRSLFKINWKIYAFGTFGLFGYHFFYFSALRHAPAAEAGLIAYLWPLLIVLFSGLLPNERLRIGHVVGALIGFLGAAIIVLNGSVGFNTGAKFGYILALICAFTWSGYSVLSRLLGDTPTSSIAVFCVATSLLSTIAHFVTETSVWPIEPTPWLAVIGLGIGPVGLAFFVWDIGVKKGNIQLLGVASYSAPLLSTIVLVYSGYAEVSISLGLATLLITLGAMLAARASQKK